MAPLFAALLAFFGAAPLSGRVVDAAGEACPGAAVYAELGSAGSIVETQAGDGGEFTFPPLPGELIGLIAYHPGQAFGVRTIGHEDTREGLTLRLGKASKITGVIRNPERDPVAGARVTRVLLLGGPTGSVPLAKLENYGVPVTAADETGAFALEGVPAGRAVALKVQHPAYATEAVVDIKGGDQGVEIVMYPGTEVRCSVLTHGEGAPLAQAVVEFRDALPPHATTLSVTNRQGRAGVRLKPGIYVVRALGEGHQSAGLQELRITGEQATQNITLRAAALATVDGGVCDAVSGGPVEGAHVVLFAQSNPAARVATDAQGRFELQAPAGEVSLLLHDAPGYALPEERVYTVGLSPGESRELPVFWVKKEAPPHEDTPAKE